MPLALLALGSTVDREKYEIQILDQRIPGTSKESVVMACEGALLFGVTALTGAPLQDALEVTRAVKVAHPDLTTVWGGWHPSLFPTDSLAEPSIDITVQGQGEQTFVEIVETLLISEHGTRNTEHGPRNINGICFRDNGRISQTAPRALAEMNDLPAHDYEMLDMEAYFKLKGQRQLDYISSTGCHFRCAFCADPFVFKRSWVAISPERMGTEFEMLWKKYRFTELAFQDETFFTHRNRIKDIANQIIDRKLKFDWTATMRADQGKRLGDDIFKLCVKSGMRRLLIGVESGSQEMMDWMQKDITLEEVLFCAEQCKKYGVGAIFPFIVGFPGESDESVQASLDMSKHLRSMSPHFETPIFYFKPYPGSRITQDVIKDGYTLPNSIEGWAEFDFVGSSGPWVSDEKFEMIERYKFYNRAAWGMQRWFQWPLTQLSRWRCKNDFYTAPIEKYVVETIRPLPKLS